LETENFKGEWGFGYLGIWLFGDLVIWGFGYLFRVSLELYHFLRQIGASSFGTTNNQIPK
jgi:hypothetical protein